MPERPELHKNLDSETFRSYYYLKEELVEFCRNNGLPVSGGKIEITERIALFLSGGTVTALPGKRKAPRVTAEITESTPIESDFVCSEKHRAFFKGKIGKGFSFNAAFQKWLKSHAGAPYSEAVLAYHRILEEKKHNKTTIDRQFEYNTYIRSFFADNPGKTLEQAITCWKYKKSTEGHNRYEISDLAALS